MTDQISLGEDSNIPGAPYRRRLPDSRASVTHKFEIGRLKGYVTVGLYPDGRPGEVFIKIAQHGSTISGLVDAISVLTSLALQYGVPVENLARKFEFTRFEPSGWTPHPEIRRAHSLIDYVFRWLGMEFSEGYPQQSAKCDAPAPRSDDASVASRGDG